MIEPVTETLLEELRRKIHSHQIVVWLDKDGHYTELADRLTSEDLTPLGAPVLGYRGSYLELMRKLGPLTDGLDPSPVVIHIPGANQDSIKQTPLLELNAAGYQLRKRLDTLVREAAAGRVKPDEVDAFLAGPEVTLTAADAWMAQKVAAADGQTAAMLRGATPARVIRDFAIRTRGGSGGGESELAQIGVDQLDTVWHYFATQLGLPDDWPTASRRQWARTVPTGDAEHTSVEQRSAEARRRLADIATAWALCVEYVHDLGPSRQPKAEVLQSVVGLARPLVLACRELAAELRNDASGYYRTLADDFEDQLADERDDDNPDALGRIDTFRFEEDQLLQASLRALEAGEPRKATTWANQRLAGNSLWLTLDPARRKAWELVERCASLASAIANTTLQYTDAASIDEAARRYAEFGAPIDRLHRELEQQATIDAIHDQLPHANQVRSAVATTRARWRDWADQGAQQWNRLCEQDGALPDPGCRQRLIFDQVVEPLLDDDAPTALFLVDALRYEMAQQLLELLGSQPATIPRLVPRLAELPTVTEIGMAAISPTHVNGNLRILLDSKQRKVQGFDAGGFQVKNRSQRETLYARKAGGAQCKTFIIEELLADSDKTIVKKISKSRLVVVWSEQIDKAGGAGNGLLIFPNELRNLHAAWQRLRAAGVRRFVFTADHGFLLRQPGDEVLEHGKVYDALARYAIYPGEVSDDHRVGFTLRSLGYEGADEALLVPRGLAVYPSARAENFVHGGNSPQERVIPVLTLVHKHAAGGEDQHYRVEILGEASGPGGHELHAQVIRADNQTTLALALDPVDLELRAAEGNAVVPELFECTGAKLDAGLVTAEIGKSFVLRFRLNSPHEQRVRVELYAANPKHRVDPVKSTDRFGALTPAASGVFRMVERRVEPADEPATAPAAPPLPSGDWLDEIEDPDVRKVLGHIAQHGQITEVDVIKTLGARKARAFARKFEQYRARATFWMELAQGPAGKVYQKVSDK